MNLENEFGCQLRAVARMRRRKERISIFSQFSHLVFFSTQKSRFHLDKGALITSIDVDVGSAVLAEKNANKNDSNVHFCLPEKYVGEIENRVVPALADFFDEMDIPVTFAFRGQLAQIGDPIFSTILDSPSKHEIAAHGYYHRSFTNINEAEAFEELELTCSGFQRIGVKPKTFIFPRNQINHLQLLEKFGYRSYRERGGLFTDGMYIAEKGTLFDVHPGFHLGFTYNPIFLNNIINLAAKKRRPLHIWFHPRDIYETRGLKLSSIKKVLFPIYNYAKKKEKEGTLSFETMDSAVDRILKSDKLR
jgi:peptidoglycan/xylan/chitin deacetylase (PgdA/CDA1 family)